MVNILNPTNVHADFNIVYIHLFFLLKCIVEFHPTVSTVYAVWLMGCLRLVLASCWLAFCFSQSAASQADKLHANEYETFYATGSLDHGFWNNELTEMERNSFKGLGGGGGGVPTPTVPRLWILLTLLLIFLIMSPWVKMNCRGHVLIVFG